MKNTLFLGVIVVLVLSLIAVFVFYEEPVETQPEVVPTISSYKDATYTIDNVPVKLTNGASESPNQVIGYFGNELHKDLNDDGREDVVFLLTQETGGSGTFFYVVAALNTENGYIGSHAYFLGDRIAPQTTESGTGKQIVVNYAERAPGEPMTTPPSVAKSLRLILDVESRQFGEVVADFEGEADPGRMTLGMKEWVWQKAEYNDERTITPIKSDKFTLTFLDNGTVEIGTDCNNAGGDYVKDGNLISFVNLRTTLMYCEGSQETEFLQLLENTSAFHFTSRGELIFDLKFDSGTVMFR